MCGIGGTSGQVKVTVGLEDVAQVTGTCFSYFSHCCGIILGQSTLRNERFTLAHGEEDTEEGESRRICSHETDECWYSAYLPLVIQSRSPAFGMDLPTYRVGAPNLINPI